jgi:endonuclease III-like uncharacterized protein
LLRACLQAIHEVTRRYYYHISAEESAPGSLSYLLDTSEENLREIFNICGFYNNKKSAFLLTAFETWVAGSFELGTVEVTSFRKKIFTKIGTEIAEEACRSSSRRDSASNIPNADYY